jgi:hypothetical protein
MKELESSENVELDCAPRCYQSGRSDVVRDREREGKNKGRRLRAGAWGSGL